MVSFTLDHTSKVVAVIRKLASLSSNHYAFGILSISFFNKNVSEKSVFSSFLVTLAQPNEGWESKLSHTLFLFLCQ